MLDLCLVCSSELLVPIFFVFHCLNCGERSQGAELAGVAVELLKLLE